MIFFSKEGNFGCQKTFNLWSFWQVYEYIINYVTVIINVDIPETNKSQQATTVFSLNYAGMPLNWQSRSEKGYI